MSGDPVLIPADGVERVVVYDGCAIPHVNRVGGTEIVVYNLPPDGTATLEAEGRTLVIKGSVRCGTQIGSLSGRASIEVAIIYFTLHYPLPEVINLSSS